MRDLGIKYWGSIIEKIPDYIRKEMNHGHRKVFECLYELTRRHSSQRASKAIYTTPSQKYISERTSLRVETVSRRVQDLQRWGLIKITHRRKVEGRFQTNLYRLGHVILLALGWLKSWINSFTHRLTNKSKIVTTIRDTKTLKDKNAVNNKSPDNSDYQAVLERLKESAQKIGRWRTATT